MIYTEIILKKENFTMNNIIKAGQPTELKNLISYEEATSPIWTSLMQTT